MLNAFDLAILLPGIQLTVIAVQYCLQQQKTENNLNPLTGNLMNKLWYNCKGWYTMQPLQKNDLENHHLKTSV